MPRTLVDWRPEDPTFWQEQGRGTASRNLWISMPALLLAFAVWMVWSIVAVQLPAAGFAFDTNQLFWLTALPGLSGATLRIFYSFMVPIFGGRAWTALSTLSLLLPAVGVAVAVRDPATPYWVFLALALLCGLGGGNFASSMANISFFYPRASKGTALALNAGLGNLGVSVAQFVIPVVIGASVFGALGGAPQVARGTGQPMWLQNAGLIWIPFILAATAAAWFGMNSIASARASLRDQIPVFKRRHTWIMAWLYTGTFGSFIGFSAGFPLLAKTEFPEADLVGLAFLGPLVGALTRAASGRLVDRFGGVRVTLLVFIGLGLGVVGVLYFLAVRGPGGFLGTFIFLFAVSGIGNASTFQMIPVIFRKERQRALANTGMTAADIQRHAEREAAAVIGITSAVAAYGAFFIPKSFGTAIAATGAPTAALLLFLAFYASCVALTWWAYMRRDADVRLID